MWCRTILTAVAISYVICVLLLNGLQKEDLDANTLDKLRRFNVNFEDMNNEKLRQECLLNSYSDTRNVTQKKEPTEDQNKTMEMSTRTISDNKDINLTDYLELKIGVPENIGDNDSRRGVENNKTDGLISHLQTLNNDLKTNNVIVDLANVTKIEENNGIQMEYLHNQPSLQSVMNFWTKLTHNTKKVITKVATTPAPPNIVEDKNISTAKVETSHNNGYVHSREMEYISRILAEYVASQTVPTTTQRVTTKKVYIGLIAKRLEDYIKISPKDENSNPLFRADIEQLLNNNLGKVNNFTRDEVRPRKVNNIYSMPEDNKNKPYKVMYDNIRQKENIQDYIHQRQVDYNYMTAEIKSMPYVTYDNNQQIKRIQDKSYNQQTQTEKNIPIRFLNYPLQNEMYFKLNGVPIPNTEPTTKSITLEVNADDERKENSETFNRSKFVQYKFPDFNNSDYRNSDRNQNVGIINDQFKDEPTDKRAWEPIRNYRLVNKQFQLMPANKIETDQQSNYKINDEKFKIRQIMTNLELAENFGMNDQFKTLPSNINDSKRIKTFSIPSDINYSEQMQNFNAKLRPEKIRKEKQNKNTEMVTDQFKDMLPSIKQSKQYQNRMKNLRTELNKSEQLQDFLMYDDQFKDMVADKMNRNQISAMNNDQLNVKPAHIKKEEQNPNLDYNDNQFKMPALRTTRLKNPKNQFKYNMQEKIDSFKRNQSNDTIESQAIPSNVIDDIAEKVRQIVLKDIRKEVLITSTTTVKSSSSTTTTVAPTTSTTTASPSTASTVTTTEKPTTMHKELKEANNVIQKLMEMFDEFKAMKIAVSSTTEVPLKVTLKYDKITRQQVLLPMQTFPPALAAFNPYIMKTPPVNFLMKTSPINVKPFEVSPYGPSMVPVPISSGANPPKDPASQYVPQINFQQINEYKSPAITIQTNADEIAPLAIQISKPIKLMNQHIIVTTKSPSEILKEEHERESKHRLDEKYFGPTNVRNYNEKHHVPLDLEKKVRFPDTAKRHEYSDTYSYKSKFNRNRDNPRYDHQYSENVPDITHSGSSRYPWSSTHPGSSSYPGSSSHPGSSSYPGSSIYPSGPSFLGNSNQPENSRHPWSSNQIGSSSYPGSLSQKRGYTWNRSSIDNLNHPRALSHSSGLNYAENRQDGLKYHAGYRYDPERPRPRYEATKFHEQLERIESWPRNSWISHRILSTEKNCCEEIPARQQMPLSKVKQRTRFDDTHFTNFLKSQQKVTDMLERILANNIKSNGPRSVETP